MTAPTVPAAAAADGGDSVAGVARAYELALRSHGKTVEVRYFEDAPHGYLFLPVP